MTPADQAAFRYGDYELGADATTLTCRYEVGGRTFTERFELGGDLDRATTAESDRRLTDQAARLVHLLTGVSYYKTSAPPVVDLGPLGSSELERRFLRQFLVEGLGEFAQRNHLDLGGLEVLDALQRPAGQTADQLVSADPGRLVTTPPGIHHPLVPFGGGIDSIVTLEEVHRHVDDVALVVVDPAGQRFEAIEGPAAVSGLPVVHVSRRLDPQVLASRELGFLNGHVPVTGIISAVAVWVALRLGRDAVVMANEWSASHGSVQLDGRSVNHQYSKSSDFEDGFRRVLATRLDGTIDYFSLLRSRSELWVGRRFAELPEYHGVFRSCNRAFHQDPAARLDRWCGRCDKCCFIDLVLAPFMARAELESIFDGHEPLADRRLLESFRTLLGIGGSVKPFECVGEPSECRVAAAIAADRPDRADSDVLQELAREARAIGFPPPESLVQAMGPDHVPREIAPGLLV